MNNLSKGKIIIPMVVIVGVVAILVLWQGKSNSPSQDFASTQLVPEEDLNTPTQIENPTQSSFTQEAGVETMESTQSPDVVEGREPTELPYTATTDPSLIQTSDAMLAATETAAATEYAVQPTPRTEMEGTNPGSVVLASGQPQLIEFFAFW